VVVCALPGFGNQQPVHAGPAELHSGFAEQIHQWVVQAPWLLALEGMWFICPVCFFKKAP
jgi:hypothetical protein